MRMERRITSVETVELVRIDLIAAVARGIDTAIVFPRSAFLTKPCQVVFSLFFEFFRVWLTQAADGD